MGGKNLDYISSTERTLRPGEAKNLVTTNSN